MRQTGCLLPPSPLSFLLSSLSPMALWGEKVNFINRRRVAVDEGKEMGFCLRGKDLKVRCVCVCVCVYLTCVHEHTHM